MKWEGNCRIVALSLGINTGLGHSSGSLGCVHHGAGTDHISRTCQLQTSPRDSKSDMNWISYIENKYVYIVLILSHPILIQLGCSRAHFDGKSCSLYRSDPAVGRAGCLACYLQEYLCPSLIKPDNICRIVLLNGMIAIGEY